MFDKPTRTYSADPATDWDRFVAAQPTTHELAAQAEEQEQELLCDADAFSDWLCGESTSIAFHNGYTSRFNLVSRAVDALKQDADNAREIDIPELLALVLGVTPFNEVRIAAADELARRYLEEMA